MQEFYVTVKPTSKLMSMRGSQVFPIQIKSIKPSQDGEWVTITSTDPSEERHTVHSDLMKDANPTESDMGYYVIHADDGCGMWMSTKDFWDKHHKVEFLDWAVKPREYCKEDDDDDEFMNLLESLYIGMDEKSYKHLLGEIFDRRSKYEKQLERQHQRDVKIMWGLAAAIPIITFLVYVFAS